MDYQRLIIPVLVGAAIGLGLTFLAFSLFGGPAERGPENSPAPALTAEDKASDSPTLPATANDRRFDPVAIYRRSAPAVATVLPAVQGRAMGQGSGFLVGKNLIATNAHVLLDQQGQRYREVYLQWQSGDRWPAKIETIDLDTDLAVLKSKTPDQLRPLPLGDSQQVVPGQAVAALGSPFGAPQSLSTGIISAVGRSVQSLSRFQISGALQTDAAINPGNSGGPLLDDQGEVIGINQQIQSSSGGSDGVGYAIPVADLKNILARQGRRPAYLGISTQEVWPQLAQRLKVPKNSLLITEVFASGPGARAGLRGGQRQGYFQGSPIVWGGDLLLSLDGQKMSTSAELSAFLAQRSPGEKVPAVIWRQGKEKQLQVTLGARPKNR